MSYRLLQLNGGQEHVKRSSNSDKWEVWPCTNTGWASSFFFCCSYIFVFICSRCKQRVSTVYCSDKITLSFTYCRGNAHPMVCKYNCLWPLGAGQGVLSSQHPHGRQAASLWPERRSWHWLMNLARPRWRGCFASFCPLIWWLPAGSRVRQVRQRLSQQFDTSALILGGFLQSIKSGLCWCNCPVLC